MPTYGRTTGRQPNAKMQVAQNGLIIYTEQWKGSGTPWFHQGQGSDRVAGVALVEIAVDYDGDNCGTWTADLKYIGIDSGRYTKPAFRAETTFNYTCSQEPIDSHPRFIEFAGTPNNEINGAWFDRNSGGFERFKPYLDTTPPEPNPWAGISQYNMPIGTLVVSSVSDKEPTAAMLSYVGKIVNKPLTAPELPPGRTWLMTGLQYKSVGGVYFEIQETYAGSGYRGWNTEIYGQ